MCSTNERSQHTTQVWECGELQSLVWPVRRRIKKKTKQMSWNALRHEHRTALLPELSQGNDTCTTLTTNAHPKKLGRYTEKKSRSETVWSKNLLMVREASPSQVLLVFSDAVGVQVATPPVAMPRLVALSRFLPVHHLAVPVNGASCAGTANPAPGRCYLEET